MPRTKVIYRIEHNKTKLGPFSGKILRSAPDKYQEEYADELNHFRKRMEYLENPFNDVCVKTGEILGLDDDEYCAFKDKTQLRKFISPRFIEFLNKQNASIKRMKVINPRIGKHQVLFRREYIVEEMVLDINMLYK